MKLTVLAAVLTAMIELRRFCAKRTQLLTMRLTGGNDETQPKTSNRAELSIYDLNGFGTNL